MNNKQIIIGFYYIIYYFIRSPKDYKFLRKQDLLPLPHPKTIRRYLSLIKTKCGFDEKFFLLLKKKFELLNEQERHGMLVFDEIFLRESTSVNTKSLSYTGLQDFGDDKSCIQKADHGLVFMFRSLMANYSQPIAVFAAKGSTKGKIFIIILLYNINSNFTFAIRFSACSINFASNINA